MPEYKVTRLIRAAVKLGGPCEVDGIELRPIQPFHPGEILVTETIEADRWQDASKLFDQHLLTVADAVSVVMGAALAPLGASTLIEKRRSRYIFVNAVKKRSAAAMTIVPE